MVVLSKELTRIIIDNETCKTIYHPRFEKCTDFMGYTTFNLVRGVFKFFIPIYMLELLTHYKKIRNKDYLKRELENFMKSCTYGFTMAFTMLSTICTCRYLIGKFYYETAVFLPGLLSGFSIFLENPTMKILNTILFSTLALECGINYLEGEDIIKNSANRETVFFMITNAFFVYLYKSNKFAKKATLLWFMDPRPQEDIGKNECCTKNYNCLQRIFKDSLKTFGTGYAFFAVKALIGRFKTILKTPSNIVRILFSQKYINGGLFFGTYVLIYKLTCRYLRETEMEEKQYHSILAGLLAGLSYRFSPNIQMNLLPLVLTMQLLWINAREIYKIPRWIFPELFFALCCAILLHFKLLKPDYCPDYFNTTVDTISNGQAKEFQKDISDFLERKIEEKGVPITKYMHVRGYK